MDWTNACIASIKNMTPTVREIALRPDGGARDYSPGSHIEIAITVGSGEIKRSYSLVGLPDPSSYRIAVKLSPESRGGSKAVFALAEGDVVRISEPRNNFPLSFDRPDYLMVAAGIGITPIIGMALALKRRGARVRLIYAASASDELAFARELDEQFDGVWERAVSSAGTRMNVRSALASVLPDGEVYICGPTRLLEEARAEWQALGRRIESLRFETFASGGNFAARPFTVKLPHLGMQIEVRGTETIVEALRRANVDVLFDCLRGECGLCALPVLALEGEIDHRDVFLSAAEKKEGTRICACVSRIVGEAISLDNGFRAHHVMD